jgi:hypothetical protein
VEADHLRVNADGRARREDVADDVGRERGDARGEGEERAGGERSLLRLQDRLARDLAEGA